MPLAVTGFFCGLLRSSSSSSSTSTIRLFFLGLRCVISYLCHISALSRLLSDSLAFWFLCTFIPEPLAPLFTSSSRSFCLRVHSSDSLILNFPSVLLPCTWFLRCTCVACSPYLQIVLIEVRGYVLLRNHSLHQSTYILLLKPSFCRYPLIHN